MRTATRFGMMLALIGGLTMLAYGLNYQYFSEVELTVFNDRIKFWHGDTLAGPVRSNGEIAIMQDPIFEDLAITSAADFWHGTGYSPAFPNLTPVFNAPELALPTQATWVREQALAQGNFLSGGDSLLAAVKLDEELLHVWWVRVDDPADTVSTTGFEIPLAAVFFFDAEVRLAGVLDGELILGASRRIGLEDNVLYASSNPQDGTLAPLHTEKLAVISEDEIKILNTEANGRENGCSGIPEPDSWCRDIALNGIYVALGTSFTFENQNDTEPDSGYVCECTPDERGVINLWGSLMQRQRGYTHRSTRYGTGYLKNYRYDEELRHWELHLFDARENVLVPEVLDMGEIAVGELAMDTVALMNDYVPLRLDSVRIGAPFQAVRIGPPMLLPWHPQIRVSITATEPGLYVDTLRFYVPYYERYMAVPVRANAVSAAAEPFAPLPGELTFAAAPNPFNAQTALTFTLPTAGRVTLELFDLLGRKVAMLADDHFTAGSHTLRVDGAALGTGIYFARLATATDERMVKLALIK